MDQIKELASQLLQALQQSLDMLTRMEFSQGSIMFLTGCVGVIIGVLLLVISLGVFPIRRKRMLKKLKKSDE